MKLIQLAVASIVDANTGHGLVHSGGNIDYAAAERHGRAIRARSVGALLEAIRDAAGAAIGAYRVRAKQRRDLRTLQSLNNHLLRDIGIERADLFAVESGDLSLSELNAARRVSEQPSPTAGKASVGSIAATLRRDAANEAYFKEAHCA